MLETTIGGEQLTRYRRIVREVTHCIMRDISGDLDNQAKGRDDYEYELLTHAWLKLVEWRAGPRATQGPTAEHKFVCKCIWNQAREFERWRLRKRRCAPMVNLTETRMGLDTGFEDRAIARQTLRMLRMRLEPRDWEMLCQVAVAEGYSLEKTRRKHQRLKNRARKNAFRVSLFLENGIRSVEGSCDGYLSARQLHWESLGRLRRQIVNWNALSVSERSEVSS